MSKRKRKDEDGTKKKVNKGVSKTKKGDKFQARIMIGSKRQNLGVFDTAKEAAKAYDLAAIQAGRSGFTGVSKARNKFQAHIKIGGKPQYLGVFDTAKEAAIAYDCEAIKQKKERNFPDINDNSTFISFSFSFISQHLLYLLIDVSVCINLLRNFISIFFLFNYFFLIIFF